MGCAILISRPLLTWPLLCTMTWPDWAPYGTRAITKSSELTTIEPRTPAKLTSGRANRGGLSALPTIRTSPPGNDAAGSMASMYGLPSAFLRRGVSEVPMKVDDSPRHKIKVGLQQNQRVKSCSYVVHHDTGSPRQLFQAAQGKRFHNVEYTKEYKTGKQVFPMRRNTYEGNHLAGNLVDHHETRILAATFSSDHSRRRNPKQRNSNCHRHPNRRQPRRRDDPARAPPQQDHDGCSVCPRPRSQETHAEEGCNEPRAWRFAGRRRPHVLIIIQKSTHRRALSSQQSAFSRGTFSCALGDG